MSSTASGNVPPQIRRSDCQRYEQPPLPAATLRNCVFITLITSQLPPPSYYHSPRTITTCLPSKKGRWIAGKAQTVALLRFACDTPAFFNLPNLSAVKTEGLHSVSTIILIDGIWSGSQPRRRFYLLRYTITASLTFSSLYKKRTSLFTPMPVFIFSLTAYLFVLTVSTLLHEPYCLVFP